MEHGEKFLTSNTIFIQTPCIQGVNECTLLPVTLMTSFSRPLEATSSVVLDCSRKPEIASNPLLEWVKACPERGMIHVILPGGRRPAATLSFQRSLVGLGCTVTTRLQNSPRKV